MLHSLKKMFKSNYLFTFGVIICLFWIIMAIIAPMVAPYDPVVQDLTLRLKAPSAAHIFGTDNFGRDIFSRVIYGARVSLSAALTAVALSLLIGIPLGAIAGSFGGCISCGTATDDNNLVFHRYRIYCSIFFLINSTNSCSLTGITEANFPFPYSIST